MRRSRKKGGLRVAVLGGEFKKRRVRRGISACVIGKKIHGGKP